MYDYLLWLFYVWLSVIVICYYLFNVCFVFYLFYVWLPVMIVYLSVFMHDYLFIYLFVHAIFNAFVYLFVIPVFQACCLRPSTWRVSCSTFLPVFMCGYLYICLSSSFLMHLFTCLKYTCFKHGIFAYQRGGSAVGQFCLFLCVIIYFFARSRSLLMPSCTFIFSTCF